MFVSFTRLSLQSRPLKQKLKTMRSFWVPARIGWWDRGTRPLIRGP